MEMATDLGVGGGEMEGGGVGGGSAGGVIVCRDRGVVLSGKGLRVI